MSTKQNSIVLLVVFGVIAPILVQCRPAESASDIDGVEISAELEHSNTPIPIISQTDTSLPDGSFSYRCVCFVCVCVLFSSGN